MSSFDKGLAIVAAVIVLTISQAFVVAQMWTWFVIPVFPAAPELSIGEALGLLFVLAFLKQQVKSKRQAGLQQFIEVLTEGASHQIIWLSFAAILHFGFGVGV